MIWEQPCQGRNLGMETEGIRKEPVFSAFQSTANPSLANLGWRWCGLPEEVLAGIFELPAGAGNVYGVPAPMLLGRGQRSQQ